MLYPSFALFLLLRIIVGGTLDLPLALFPWIWLLIKPARLPFRDPFFLAFLLLGAYTTLMLLIPRQSLLFGNPFTLLPLPPRFSLPSWAETELGGVPNRLHLAPWEGASWILRFLGGAGWLALFSLPQPERNKGVDPLLFLKIVFLLVSLLVFSEVVGFQGLPYLSRVNPNHKAAFLLATLPFFLRGSSLWALLFPAGILFAIYSTQALFPSFLGTVLFLGALLRIGAKKKEGTIPSPSLQSLPFRDRLFILGSVVLPLGATLLFLPVLYPSLLTSIKERLLIWKETLLLIQEHPLTGIGFGAYPWVKPLYALYPRSTAIRALHPENGYLWFLAEGGAIGLCLVFLPFLLSRKEEASKPRGTVSLFLLLFLGLSDVPWLWGGCFYLLPYLCAPRGSERGKGGGGGQG